MQTVVVGQFRSAQDAEEAVGELIKEGYVADDIGFASPQTSSTSQTASTLEEGTPQAHEFRRHLTTGTAIGGIAGLLLGELMIPGVGWVGAAGTLGVALAGVGLGALAGTLPSATESLGVRADPSVDYARALQKGRSLLVVRSKDSREDVAINTLIRHGAVEVNRIPDSNEALQDLPTASKPPE